MVKTPVSVATSVEITASNASSKNIVSSWVLWLVVGMVPIVPRLVGGD